MSHINNLVHSWLHIHLDHATTLGPCMRAGKLDKATKTMKPFGL